MPGTRCTVAVCNNSAFLTKRDPSRRHITYHKFPKDPYRRRLWVIQCRRGGQWNPSTCHVCSEHFEPNDFVYSPHSVRKHKRRHLKPTAIPSRNLYAPVSSPDLSVAGISGIQRREKFYQENDDLELSFENEELILPDGSKWLGGSGEQSFDAVEESVNSIPFSSSESESGVRLVEYVGGSPTNSNNEQEPPFHLKITCVQDEEGSTSRNFYSHSLMEGGQSSSRSNNRKRTAMKNYVVIDTDCGVDDAVAILYALSNPDWEILAITCCAGNTNLESVSKNVLRVLTVIGKTDIPVYSGCSSSLVSTSLHASYYHGDDGFGGVASKFPVGDAKVVNGTHAANAIIDLVKEYPGQISLIALGPLTNLAVAQRLDPEFSRSLRELFIMGGNTEGMGNVAIASEFNFAFDPEAAHIILSEVPLKCQVKIVPWETCVRSGIPWDAFHSCLKAQTIKADLLSRIYAKGIENQRASDRPGFVCCDFFAMVAMMNPECITSEKNYPVYIELHGEYTRGMMVLERRPKFTTKVKTSNPTIVFELDVDVLCETFAMLLQQ